ncbi:MAG: Gfo/Idh/MocA family oxidoreductase [Rhodospirillaceae bacterium]|nr:MAG: Gfo/Idh/MocA family oxidoreductase [Rhodospirillaceae bacterium]
MTSAGPLSVGIIGLGRIAEGYDSPTGPGIATHIKACLNEPRLNIAWIADVDPARSVTVQARWGLSAERLTPKTLIERRPDVLCIASPDDTHPAWIETALKIPPRLILCEKPLGSNLATAQRLIDACAAAGVALVVNFPRRWLPGISDWLAKARGGGFGPPIAARLIYCRGLRHNACHGLDLIGAALGPRPVVGTGSAWWVEDFSVADPTVSATISVNVDGSAVPITLTGVDGRRLNIFDADILYAGGGLRIWNDQGIRAQISVAGAPPAGHEATELHGERSFHDRPARYMLAVWQNIADHLCDDQPLLCRAEDTIDGMRLVEAFARIPKNAL